MGKTKTAFLSETEEKKKKPSNAKAKDGKVHVSGLKGGQRIKAIEAESPSEISSSDTPSDAETSKGLRKPKVRSKNYQTAKTKIDVNKLYPTEVALKLTKESSYTKFDGTIELHFVVKKVGQSVSITLPHKAGKDKKVEIASEETMKKLEKGVIDFDVLLATPEMMPKLVVFARLLGPKGLMPNPKQGTLVKSASDIKNFSTGAVILKTEKERPVVHTILGKVSMKESELKENLDKILEAFGKNQIVKAYLNASMGPSVKLQIA